MYLAFRNVKHNRGAAGIDKVSIRMFEANLYQNLDALMHEIKTRDAFKPKPLRRVFIPKGKGKMRPLGIPAVRDRIVQEVLRQLLSPIFEPLFHEDSFGFRPVRNCHQALDRVLDLRYQGYKVVLDADIQGFFDNIPHSVIMARLANEVADGNILGLVERFLRAGVMENGVFKPTTVGTPQGGVISPLLANIALNSLDWLLERQGLHFVRYADDFVVMCRNHAQAKEALTLVQSHLEGDLELKLSPEKTHISTFSQGFSFLGFDFHAQTVTMRNKSLEKFKTKIREITERSHNLDKALILRLNQVIRGTANYFATSFSHNRRLFKETDKWIRVRLRSMKYKRKWKTDNWRLRLKHFRRMGLLSLYHFYTQPA
uniref:Group II intron reverse transcriptase/maturase n=1 Tax=Candidatus Kentrum sp. FW TaxID=2126338 RepID=A0A450TKY5_9GAMM|nr:MAG: group II intron reverse transcriptase/maturase [Candidatus Kentron sp. FW]